MSQAQAKEDGGHQAERFGTLAEVCDRLQRLQQQLATPVPASAWRTRLEAVIDALMTDGPAQAVEQPAPKSTKKKK